MLICRLPESEPGEDAGVERGYRGGVAFYDFNPEYIKEVMKGGASSASQITEVVTNTYGWNVTKPDVVDQEMWNKIYDVYVKDAYQLGTEQFSRLKIPPLCRRLLR